jgi:hypothetical protein
MTGISDDLPPSSPVPPDLHPEESSFAMLSVVAEDTVPNLPGVHVASRSGMRVVAANRLRDYVGSWLMRSMTSPRRYARGTVSFLDSQLLGRRIAEAIGPADNVSVLEIDGIDANLAAMVARTMPAARRADLLRTPLAEMRERFEVSHEQAVTLRRAALGMLAPPSRAGRRAAQDHPTVPDVLGLHLEEARAQLSRLRLKVGSVADRDSEQPQHTVLEQRPGPGVVVAPDTAIDLVLATGLTVRVPDLVGRNVGEALRLLHDAGLRSEPDLVFVRSPGRRKHTVIEAEPRSRTHVTPHARVVLHVVEGG